MSTIEDSPNSVSKQSALFACAKAACFRKFYLSMDEYMFSKGIPATRWIYHLDEYMGFAE